MKVNPVKKTRNAIITFSPLTPMIKVKQQNRQKAAGFPSYVPGDNQFSDLPTEKER